MNNAGLEKKVPKALRFIGNSSVYVLIEQLWSSNEEKGRSVVNRIALATSLAGLGLIGKLAKPKPAYADLKSRSPQLFGQEGLVSALVGPAPRDAKVVFTDERIFSAAAREIGPDAPDSFPQQYRRALHRMELFNISMFWDFEELLHWEERHGFAEEMTPEIRSILEEYLNKDYVIIGTLIQYPKTGNPAAFKAHGIVLQRAVIVYDEGRENLFLRSYAHSVDDSGNSVNFVPRGGIEMSFASDVVWYPLMLTEIINEPAAHVVLDILTTEPTDLQQIGRQLPGPLEAVEVESKLGEVPGQMEYQGKNYHVTRITGQLPSKQRWDDLSIEVYYERPRQ